MLTKTIDWIDPAWKPIEPRYEMGAYESLWLNRGVSFKSLADKFKDCHFGVDKPYQLACQLPPLYAHSI